MSNEGGIGSCYGKDYEDRDPACRGCFVSKRCQSAMGAKLKREKKEEQKKSVEKKAIKKRDFNKYFVRLLSFDIGDYEIEDGNVSVLYEFIKDGKYVCSVMVSKVTGNLKIETSKYTKEYDRLTSKDSADDLVIQIVNIINENL